MITEKGFQLVYNWIFIFVWNKCHNRYFKKAEDLNSGLVLTFDSSFEVFCLFGINARLCLLLFWHKKTANFNDQIMMLQLSRRPTIFGLSQCAICKILNNSTMHSGQKGRYKDTSIYNIIRWFAGKMVQMNCRPSIWCSKY